MTLSFACLVRATNVAVLKKTEEELKVNRPCRKLCLPIYSACRCMGEDCHLFLEPCRWSLLHLGRPHDKLQILTVWQLIQYFQLLLALLEKFYSTGFSNNQALEDAIALWLISDSLYLIQKYSYLTKLSYVTLFCLLFRWWKGKILRKLLGTPKRWWWFVFAFTGKIFREFYRNKVWSSNWTPRSLVSTYLLHWKLGQNRKIWLFKSNQSNTFLWCC